MQTASVGDVGINDILLTVIDPGGSTTGWSVWVLPESSPIERLDYGQIKGGLKGFIHWMLDHHRYFRETIVVCEKFVSERGAEDLTPLQIEGALICGQEYLAAPEVVWQLRSRKRNLGTADVRDDLLKQHGLWITNAEAQANPEIAWKDARDCNDTSLHALIYAKDLEHLPTLRAYWPDDEETP